MGEGRGGWALADGARALWSRIRAAWSGLPRAAWRRWGVVLLFGTALCCVGMAGLTVLARGRADAGLLAWDRATLQRIIEWSPLSFDAAIWWDAFGASSLLVPLVTTAAVLSILANRPIQGLTFAAAYLLGKPIVLVGWQIWDRARPQLVAGGIAAPPLHSFPSGHAVQTAATYGLLVFVWMRASGSWLERSLAALCWVALLGMVVLARLRLGTHWPSDMVAGTVVGVAWLVVLLLALRRAEAAGGR